MEKSINYMARDFNSIREELLKFSNKYYPELQLNYEDSSVGSWLLDMVAAVGDDLSYSIDRTYQENNINSSTLRSSVLNMARLNGVKVPGPKCSMVEVELSCELGVSNNQPLWVDAPIVKRDTQVGAGGYVFELTEDVNFKEQFNNDGYSNRKFEPNRDSNGAITSYTITKSVMAIAGSSKVYKRVISENELQPFMEIILPDKNITNIESIIFKSTTGLSTNPNLYEYYIDDEEFRVKGEYVNTYRYFEVDSLADLYRYGTETETLDGTISGRNEMYVDYTESWGKTEGETTEPTSTRTTRIYKGKWKTLSQKFITEYTDNGYMKIIFGCGSSDKVPNGSTYAEYRMANVVNNSMLGVLPQAGWTMYVLYRVGGGAETNMAAKSINSFVYTDVEFPNPDKVNFGKVVSSLKVTNLSNSLAGKDAPSTEEIKYLTKYSVGSQKRCVTLNDYKARIAQMPPKYGCPFRYNALEENNKIVIPFLGLNSDGKLDTALPNLLVDNLKSYMSHYKNLTDYIEMKSGKIYNLGFELDVYIDKNYTTEYVLKSIIDTIYEYFNVDNHMMGDSIFIGDLEKEINKIDGVIGLIDLRIFNLYGGKKYGSNGNFPIYDNNNTCDAKIQDQILKVDEGSYASRIDVDALDGVLENDVDSMFEILNKTTDIAIRCKLR